MPPPFSRFNPNLLPVLDALLQERSVSRAAVRLGRSQPAVSHALRHLRSSLQDPLLIRVGQRFELSPKAQALAYSLHVLLEQLDETLAAGPTFDPSRSEREFSIATSDYLALTILRAAIPELAAVAPGVRLSIIDVAVQDVFAQLRGGQGGIAVYPAEQRPPASDLHFEALWTDTWCGAVWSGNEAIGDSLTLEEFESSPQIIELFTPVPEKDYVGRALAAQGIRRKYVIRTNYAMLMPLLLQGTSALAVLPRRMTEWFRASAELRLVSLPFELPDFAVEMCWSARYSTDPAHTWLRSVLKDAAASLR